MERCINNAGKTMNIYKCINIDTSFIKRLKERCINNAGKHYVYISPLVFYVRLSYNLPVYFVLCNCSVLSVVSVKNENYKNKKNKIKNKQFASASTIFRGRDRMSRNIPS
jgi:hypothetical protein